MSFLSSGVAEIPKMFRLFPKTSKTSDDIQKNSEVLMVHLESTRKDPSL